MAAFIMVAIDFSIQVIGITLKQELFGTTYSKHLNRQKKIQNFAVNEKIILIESVILTDW